MDKITKFFIDNPKLGTLFSVFIFIAGIMSLKNMNAETNPAVDFATAIINTSYDGASSNDIETKITKPIEDEIRQVDDIKDVKSVSQPGLSTIVLRVDMDKKGVDVDKAMADLQRAIDRVSNLPSDLEDLPLFTEIKSEEFPVATIAITGGNDRYRNYISDLLKDEIEDNKSVKSVNLSGYSERQFNIDLDLKKMNYHHIGINEVVNKIRSRNIDFPSGEIKNTQFQSLTRIEAKIKDIDELSNIIIRSNFSGELVKLSDIAQIIDSQEDAKILTRYNAKKSTILTINKKSNTDTLKLVDDVKIRLTKFSERYQDLSFNLVQDESQQVYDRISILASNAIIGLIIVLVLLFIFLPWRVGIMASLSLPLAIMATLAVMTFFDINLNTVTILALVIVLGMLVDDSVIISENFTKYYNRGSSPIEASIKSIKLFWLPITATVLTTMAAFLPMLITRGIMGEFIKWIPIIVTIALALSLIECFFFLPMRLAYFGGSSALHSNNKKQDWFHKIELKFESLVHKLIKIRYWVLIAFSVIIVFSGYLVFVANKFILFPAEQTLIYVAKVKANEGSRIENTSKSLQEASLRIKEKLGDGAQHIVANAGVNDINASQPNYKQGSDVGYIWIYVDDYTQNNVAYNEVLAQLQSIDFTDILDDISFEAQVNGPPVGSAIEATFRSDSFSDIDNMIELILPKLQETPGILDLVIDDVIVGDEIFVNINYAKADKLGLDIDIVGNAVRSAIAGIIVSQVTIDNKDVNLFVRFKENYRSSLEDLKNIMIMDASGNLVPLGNFVSFTQKKSEPYIKRYDYKRSKTLLANVNDDIISASKANQIVKDLFEKHKNDLPSVSIKFGGIEESTNESLGSLKNAFLFAIMGIFILLVFLFKSYLKPFIILTTIPLGLFGFGVAFLLHLKPVSFLALIGLVGLAGVIVNAGIVLVSYILRLKEEGEEKDLHKILSYASSMRLRSVVITSLTTIAGFAPAAYGIGGKDEVLSPMTLAMMWGLASGTILTIIWIPCAYAILDDLLGYYKRFLDFVNHKLFYFKKMTRNKRDLDIENYKGSGQQKRIKHQVRESRNDKVLRIEEFFQKAINGTITEIDIQNNQDIIDEVNQHGMTPLMLCVSQKILTPGHVKSTNLLCQNGADVMALDDKMSSVLMWAATNKDPASKLVLKSSNKIKQILFENGIEIQDADKRMNEYMPYLEELEKKFCQYRPNNNRPSSFPRSCNGIKTQSTATRINQFTNN